MVIMPGRAEMAGLYRLRADEARAVAAGIFEWEERNKLLQMADEYERRAREAEDSDSPDTQLSTFGDAEEVKHYRLRAEVLRTIAAATRDRRMRKTLLNVAHDHERRAQAREAIAKWDKKASSRNSA
jgi:hypothetical protein